MTEYDPPFHVCTVERLYEMWMSRTYTNVTERWDAATSFWSILRDYNS